MALQQLGQETVPLSVLVKRAAEAAYTGLKEVCEAAPEQSDAEKKISLLKFILKTRQRLLRLLVICKWCRQIPLVERCQQLMGTLSNHDMSFTQAADSMFYLHESLQQSRAPMYDVASAMDVLFTGGFPRMPKCIEDLNVQPVLEGWKKDNVLQKLDTLLRSKLLDIAIPKEFTSVSVRDGRLTLRVDGEFEVELTLGYRGNASLWRVLHLKLLVGESSRPAKFSDMQRLALSDDLERRMSALENPFGIIYTVLHEFCAALVMDTLWRQVRALRHGRWKDAIRLDLSFETAASGNPATQAPADAEADPSKSRVHGVKITYWLDLAKGGESLLPSLRIEPGSDQRISCQHQPPLTDPGTGNDAEFVLDQSRLDVEKLILRVINCNIHSRLVEVQKSLKANTYIHRVEDDVFLKSSAQDTSDIGEDSLHVRAYGDLYICLSISIRNGRFVLRAPSTLLSLSLVQEMEEAINQGTSVVDVFINLRNQSIIHHYASLGGSMNLKVFEKGAITLKFPEDGPKLGSDVLVLGFPNTGDLYFLAVHLDPAFMPLFVLLEAQKLVPLPNRTTVAAKHLVIRRYMSIDISKFSLAGNDENLSLLSDNVKSGGRSLVPKTAEVRNGFDRMDNQVVKLEKAEQQPNFAMGQLQRYHASPSVSLGSPSSRASFGNHNRKSSSSNNLLALVSQAMGSPARNSFSRMSPSTKLPELEYGRLKSPLLPVDNPASPDLDDDHLSKLIESISTGGPATDNMASTGLRQVHSSPSSRTVKSASKNSLKSLHLVPRKGLPDGLGSPLAKDMDRSPYLLPAPSRQLSSLKRKPESDIFSSLPSLQRLSLGARKKQKVEAPSNALEVFSGQPYAAVVAAANQGKAPPVTHMAVLLHVVKRSWLVIKHARLTNQMDSLGISYVEEGRLSSSAGLIFRLATSRMRGDMGKYCNAWQRISLSLGQHGSDGWEVKVRDSHYKSLWSLQKQKVADWGAGVQLAALSEADAHIKCSQEGLILSYSTVEDDSIKKLLADLERLRSARAFAHCMKKLLEDRMDEGDEGASRTDTKWEAITRAFKVEALGLTSLWFSYTGSMPGILARFVVEWASDQEGCIVHVSPEQLWPHTKYLEDLINGGDVELLLDAIRITAGPLHALAGAIRPARMTAPVSSIVASAISPPGQVSPPNSSATPQSRATGLSIQIPTITSGPGRGPGPGIVPSSLLPTDISVLMRSPYWIRIVYRKQFSVDMRCFEGDQVWLQPAPPPQGAGPDAGGSLPCPQFRPFVMENVLNSSETVVTGVQQNGPASANPRSNASATRNTPSSAASGRNLVIGGPGYPSYRGELNSAFCGVSDDGGYSGAWVPLPALKKVLRSTLKYLGVLWLFAQFPNIIREVLGSVMNGRDGTLLHLDPEQPALRFNIGNCMFAVNMHRHQLYLQGLNVKKFQQPPPELQTDPPGADADLTNGEMLEITEFFAQRVASEPYDASRLASFVTILTLPIAVLREFLGLISWMKEAQKNQAVEATPRPRIELCLENRLVINTTMKEEAGSSTSVKSSILHDREREIVEFALTVFLDLGPHVNVNVAGGAGWLPQCVSVRMRYYYNKGGRRVLLVGLEGSHGGRACWSRGDEWERLKERTKVLEAAAAGQESSGRLRAVAESVQLTLQSALQQLRAV
ncbi:mediator of RNA polymerase II transcription subunit 14 [Selaginella moellendorffii]|uniref:mediator of RNA polymerase II transcription subunit 14 n=1 Tax=Selaginella moellendorffii TaxID=88036 RepID=UPI000D1CD2A1|nr:mediator of RNA polymerase II transcription subunit 14 [Selaginella moellendorffii]|eukprot:XP_024534573.1 mediator of RNA polymerase II transcription subunit 14 [Selaginella moellendorffii]